MGAGFNQTALFHDKDLVSITNRRQAMGDHYNRFILNQLFKGFLNQVLVLRVAERSCLVQNDNGRVFYDSLAMAIRWRSPPERWTPVLPITV